MNFNKFKIDCAKKYCNRGNRKNILSNNCLKESKQQNCYVKYCIKIQADREKKILKKFNSINKKSLLQQLLEKDKNCKIWNILTYQEKEYILKNFIHEYYLLRKILDPCHIISRSEAPILSKDLENVFLASRYFHLLLDNNKDLVTKNNITKKQRIKWIERIMKENKIWQQNYSYEQFKKDKLRKF